MNKACFLDRDGVIIEDENAINNGYSFSGSIDEYGFIHLTPYSKTATTPT